MKSTAPTYRLPAFDPRMWLCMVLFWLTSAMIAPAQPLVPDSLEHKSAWRIKRMARQSERYNDPYSAIQLYQLYLRKRPRKTAVRYTLAGLYRNVRDYDQAYAIYRSLSETEPAESPLVWYYRGVCAMNLEQYEEAARSFDAFEERYKILKDRSYYRKALKVHRAGLSLVDSLQHHPIQATITPLKGLNHAVSESGMCFIDERHAIYSTMMQNALVIVGVEDSIEAIPRLQLYRAELRDGEWHNAGLLEGAINDPVKHVSNPVISPDGKRLFYSVCSENWQGKTVCEIYQSRLVNDKWQDPQPMRDGINESGYTSTQPALGLDLKRNRVVLYFVSDRPGGKGGLDIYYSQYNMRDDEWSKPRSVGNKINTAGNEETPWFDLKNSTMYFSSDGHPGIGGMDVYQAVGEKSKWSEATLLGIPINSGADDLYYRLQPRDRYQLVVSNRKGSQSLWNATCCDDLYEIYFPQSVEMILRITAYEVPTRAEEMAGRRSLEQATINTYLFDPVTGEKFLIRRDSLRGGQEDVLLPPGKLYLVEIEEPGFFTESHVVDTRGMRVGDVATTELSLRRWDEKPIEIPNILFDFNSDELTDDAKKKLDEALLTLLRNNPLIMLEIGAHTDSKGDDNYNMKLSQRRAESIMRYLISQGVERDRITARGYGETKPVAPNTLSDGSDNPEGRARNRRVEFTVTGTKLDVITSE